MILIISQNDDTSTIDVIKWIRHFGHEVIRINVEDKNVFIKEVDIDGKSIIVKHGDREFNLVKDISVAWMRRGHIPFNSNLNFKSNIYDSIFRIDIANKDLKDYLKAEISDLMEYVHYVFDEKCIGGYGKGKVNKLVVLDKARSLGISIPKTLVVFNKQKLAEICAKDNYITKAISDTYVTESNHIGYTTYTESVKMDDLHYLNNEIFPSLIQKEINKKIELRIFFWYGEIFTLAIFSQNDEQTKTDFRIYNKTKPNRFVPYKFPEKEAEKLVLLMEVMGLQTGSIDYILDKEGNYIFLEINPVGQFGMVSVPGTYYLEKKIAEKLIEYEILKD